MTVRPKGATWFRLDTKQSGRGFGLAKLTTGETTAELRPWYRAIAAPGRVEGWPGFTFRLARGGFADLQPVNRSFWLFSERLRDVVGELSPATPLQWLEQEVVSEDGANTRDYWSPALLEEIDMWEDGSVVRARHSDHIIHGILDVAKIERYRVVGYWQTDSTPRLHVHRELLEAAEERECASGMKWNALPEEMLSGGDLLT